MFVPMPVIAIVGIILLLLVMHVVRAAAQSTGADRIAPRANKSAADLTLAVRAEAAALIAQKRKIDAIKLIREKSGLGLKDAKDIVDRM